MFPNMTQNRNQKREKWVEEFGNCIMGNELKDKVNSAFKEKKKKEKQQL